MATTAPDSVSGLIYHNDDKKKKKNKEQQNLPTAATTPAASQKPAASGGGTKASAAPKTTPTVYEDPVTNKNAQKAAERAQKAAAKAPSSLDVSYDTQQTVAQKRQEQKDAQWMGLGNPQGSMAGTAKSSTAGTAKSSTNTAKTVTGTTKNSTDTYTAWYSGKMEVRSPFTSNQRNSTVKTTLERESPAKDTAFARPKTNTSPLWQTAGTASQWGGAKPQNTKDTYPGFERDLDSMWAKYGAQLMSEEKKKAAKPANPAKPAKTTKSAGPNAEMADTVRLAPQYRAPAVNTGPGAEMGKAVKLEGNPQNLKSAVKDLQKNTGISKETARTAFLDPRGQNITDKIINDINKEADMVRYGADYLNDKNHTNTVVTKDNIYSLPPQKVSSELKKAQENVTRLKNDKKQERDSVLFQKYMLQAQGYDKKATDSLSQHIKQLDGEIALLNIKELKANAGYEFCQEYIKMLSVANEDDILKILNEYNNLPYLGNIANASRSAKKGVDKVSDVVSVLENTKIDYLGENKGFKVYNQNNPNNSFKVVPDYTVKYGFRDYKLSVMADNINTLTPDQKNLYKTFEDIPISKAVYDFLEKPTDILKKADLDNISKNIAYTGYIFDVIDFVCLVANDSSDGNIGKDTTKKVTSMITSWLGGLAGAELGAAAGMAIGTAIMPGVGTVVSGAIGAVVGAYILSELGKDAGEYLGGLDYGSGNPIEYHLERGR